MISDNPSKDILDDYASSVSTGCRLALGVPYVCRRKVVSLNSRIQVFTFKQRRNKKKKIT